MLRFTFLRSKVDIYVFRLDGFIADTHDDMKVWMRISSRARLVTTGYNKSIKMVLMK